MATAPQPILRQSKGKWTASFTLNWLADASTTVVTIPDIRWDNGAAVATELNDRGDAYDGDTLHGEHQSNINGGLDVRLECPSHTLYTSRP